MVNIKKRAKRSIIWKLDEIEFKKLVSGSKSMKDVLSFFNMKSKGNNFRTAKERINYLNIDTSHFMSRTDVSNMSRTLSKEDFTDKWLIENSDKNRHNLKTYLVKFNLLKYECVRCGNKGLWEGEPLSLQLEHINGTSDDNRLDNLCFLCPNCHTQTPSYAGKKNKKFSYCNCGLEKHKTSICCTKCSGIKKKKINWPSKDVLEKIIWEKPTTHISKELGVSDVAIGKHIKSLGLSKPPRGYWAKVSVDAEGIEPNL